ncbi:MAG: pyridoxal-dependent decarboxylase [Byssovorax sp.]
MEHERGQRALLTALDKRVRAVALYLTTFAALSGDIDEGERSFIRAYIGAMVGQGVLGLGSRLDEDALADLLEEQQRRASALLDGMEHHVLAQLGGERSELDRKVAAAELKLGCFETFRGFARDERALLLGLLDTMGGRSAHPEEALFRDELRALLDEPEAAPGVKAAPIEGGTISNMTMTGMVEAAPGERFSVALRRQHKRAVVGCAGVLDAASAPALLDAALPLLDEPGGLLQVVVNLHGVTAVASAAARALFTIAQRAEERGMLLRLTNAQPNVRKALKLTGLAPLMNSTNLPPAPPGSIRSPSSTSSTAPIQGDLGREIAAMRGYFPSPTSSPRDDAYAMWSLLRGVEAIDRMKTAGHPYFGERKPLDLERARGFRLPESPAPIEQVVQELAGYLEGHMIFGHPLFQANVIPPPAIPAVAGQLFASMHNPNTIWDGYCHRIAEAEIEAISAVAELVGYDPSRSGGVFTYGGSGTLLYALKVGLEKALPGAMQRGVREPVKVIVSDVAHYASLTAMGWLGIGTENLIKVPTDDDNSMRPHDLEEALRRELSQGHKVGAIVVTTGSTDAFGIDDVEHAVRLRDDLVKEYGLDYRPHVHADAVIGWAFSVFCRYDFAANPLGFDARALRSLWDTQQALRPIAMADSFGVDFHKTGYAPYTSSAFIVKDLADLQRLGRSAGAMPYLFQYGSYRPGEFTLETTRSGCSVLSALGNLKSFGRRGLQVLLGHAVSMAERLRLRLEAIGEVVILNDYNHGPVTLFRVYPKGVDAERAYREETSDLGKREALLAHNEHNRTVLRALLARADAEGGVYLGQTERYRTTPHGDPILALKSYVLTPFATEAVMDSVAERLVAAAEQVASAG